MLKILEKPNYYKFTKPAVSSFLILLVLELLFWALKVDYIAMYFAAGFVLGAFVLGNNIDTYLVCKDCEEDGKEKIYKKYVGFFPLLVQPWLLFTALFGFLFLNSNTLLQQIFIFLSIAVYFVSLSEFFTNYSHTAHDTLKLLAVFLTFDVILEGVKYFAWPNFIAPLGISLMTFVFLFYMFWRFKSIKKSYVLAGLLIAILLGAVGFAGIIYWPLASYFLLSILLFAVYYMAWAFLHHHIEGDLTRDIFFEYLFVSLFLIIVVLSLVFNQIRF